MTIRPGIEQDATRAWAAARAEEATQQAQPDLASRAAALAARVADLVTQSAEPAEPAQSAEPELGDRDTEDQTDRLARLEVPTTNLTERAEAVRRSAARFSANSASTRVAARHADRESGVTTRGNRNT